MDLQKSLLSYIIRTPMGFLERMAYIRLHPEEVFEFDPKTVDWNHLLGKVEKIPEA